MEIELASGTDEGREGALRIYSEGAFSGSYADVVLDSGLPIDLAKGLTVFGISSDGSIVRGALLAPSRTGDFVLKIKYYISPIQEAWSSCHVGGNPNPTMSGCKLLSVIVKYISTSYGKY